MHDSKRAAKACLCASLSVRTEYGTTLHFLLLICFNTEPQARLLTGIEEVTGPTVLQLAAAYVDTTSMANISSEGLRILEFNWTSNASRHTSTRRCQRHSSAYETVFRQLGLQNCTQQHRVAPSCIVWNQWRA
jgi:hypothetical protein